MSGVSAEGRRRLLRHASHQRARDSEQAGGQGHRARGADRGRAQGVRSGSLRRLRGHRRARRRGRDSRRASRARRVQWHGRPGALMSAPHRLPRDGHRLDDQPRRGCKAADRDGRARRSRRLRPGRRDAHAVSGCDVRSRLRSGSLGAHRRQGGARRRHSPRARPGGVLAFTDIVSIAPLTEEEARSSPPRCSFRRS